jgi:hypothetical protein
MLLCIICKVSCQKKFLGQKTSTCFSKVIVSIFIAKTTYENISAPQYPSIGIIIYFKMLMQSLKCCFDLLLVSSLICKTLNLHDS